jgi:uncharacterized protein YcbK (DUF882 family)
MFEYFDISEFDCQYTGENKMDPSFIHSLDELREACGFPFQITSGYRSPNHPIEIIKDNPGQHAKGIAADIRVRDGDQRYTLVREAMRLGFKGVGAAKSYVHVDKRDTTAVLWTY